VSKNPFACAAGFTKAIGSDDMIPSREQPDFGIADALLFEVHADGVCRV
jgi:hypothetical protein